MFKEWLTDNNVREHDFLTPLFPPASERRFWDKYADAEIIKNGENFLGFEIPTIRATQYMAYHADGDRIAQETPHFARRRALITLAMAELCEYRGRFLPDLTDLIFAVCEETFWGVSAHASGRMLPDRESEFIDLFAAETAEILSVIRYLFSDALSEYCPEILARTDAELERRIIKPYLTHKDFWWMGYGSPVNNWNPWIESNVLTVFLLSKDRGERFYEAIGKMFFEIDFWYNAQRPDGACDEGASYWTVAGGKFFEFCEQLYLSSGGKVDFFCDEKVKNIGAYEYRAYIGNGYFVNFADGTPKLSGEIDWIAYEFGLRTGNERLMALGREMLKYKVVCQNAADGFSAVLARENKIKREIFSLILRDEICSAPDFVPDRRFLLPDTQIAAVREGKWFVAAKGGNNAESHNHNDVGSFIAYHESSPVLVDPSCGTYTKRTFSDGRYSIWTMSGAWHNVPELSGFDEKEGSDHRASSFALNDNTVEISFADAYPDEADVITLDRKVTVSDLSVCVEDEIVLAKDGKISEHFVTPLDVEIAGDHAVLGGRFALSCGSECEISVEKVNFEGDAKLVRYWEVERMNRVIFTLHQRDARLVFNLALL